MLSPRVDDDRARLLQRLETPLERASELKERTLGTFPVRVWRGFLRGNGFLLSAGMSYYVLFSMFAVIYVASAGVGIWLGASKRAIGTLIDVANSYIPGLISDHGLVSVREVEQIAQSSTGLLGVTGAVAVGFAIWTAVAAVTFTRRAVRDIFGLPFDTRGYWRLKLRDFFAGMLFAAALLVGAALSGLSVWALEQLFEALGWTSASWVLSGAGRTVPLAIAFAVDAGAVALLMRFLVGANLRWRFIVPAALLGGGATVILQLSAGILLGHVPSNPLLASFAVVIGLLLWCRLLAIVVLVAASWIAVTAADHDQPLELADEAAAVQAEHEALILAARVQLRRARDARSAARGLRRWSADRTVRSAETGVAEAIAEAEGAGVSGPR